MYRPLKVKELASHFNISESKLGTLFKTELGSTVQDYIIERKIEEAKLMLKSNVTTNEAAYTLGFADASHFSRVFKRSWARHQNTISNQLLWLIDRAPSNFLKNPRGFFLYNAYLEKIITQLS